MQPTNIKSLGFELTINVPSSVEEFDQLAKRAGACLTEATANVLYRGTLAEFRDTFCEELEKETGIARLTKVTGKSKAGEDIIAYAETEADYVKRVAAEKSVEVSSFADLANRVAAAITFDPSATERKGGAPKKVAKLYLNIVEEVEKAAGPDGLVKVAAKLSSTLGRAVTVDVSTPEALAKSREVLAVAIKEDQDRKKAEMAASLLA